MLPYFKSLLQVEKLKTEINVATWLAVIAEMARSRMKSAVLDDPVDVQRDLVYALEVRMMDAPDQRREWLRIAAQAIRMVDEFYPGDGLEF